MTSTDNELLFRYLDTKFEALETGLKSYVDEKFNTLGKKINNRINETEKNLKYYVDSKFDALDAKINANYTALSNKIDDLRTYTETGFKELHAVTVQLDRNLSRTDGQMRAFDSQLSTLQIFFYAGFAFIAFITGWVSLKNSNPASSQNTRFSREDRDEIISIIDSKLANLNNK